MPRLRLLRGLLALVAVVGGLGPTGAEAQVFIATRPRPPFTVAPLFIAANVAPGVTDVPVEVTFSLMIPPTRSALELQQDLYFLWPGGVVATDTTKADIVLPPDVAAQLSVIAEGRLPLYAQRHYETSATPERIPGGAPFVTVVRTGGPQGLSAPATYVRIPWTPRLANQAWLMSFHLTARGLVKPRPATWIGRTVAGPRGLVVLGFNDVGAPAMFSMYFWQRDRVVPVGSPGRLEVNFAHADRLAIDAMFPPAARRDLSQSRESTEVVSLFLAPAEGLTPQVLRVEYGYFSGLQSWGPIVVPALFFALGNAAAVLARAGVERLRRRVAGHLQLGRRRASAAELETGTVIPRERLARVVPGETTYEEVLRICGQETEERQGLALPGRRILVYRGRRDVPHRQLAWRWLATVSHWDVERHEVEITIEDGVVKDIETRVGRAGAARPDVGGDDPRR